MNKNKHLKCGFTLVELLVVMAVIAVLATLSMFGLQGVRETARDAVRQADLETIRAALEMYRADCDTYPTTPNGYTGSGRNFGNYFGANTTFDDGDGSCTVVNGNIYLNIIPDDPIAARYYRYISDGTTYGLCASLEGAIGSIACGSSVCGGVQCNYQVVSF